MPDDGGGESGGRDDSGRNDSGGDDGRDGAIATRRLDRACKRAEAMLGRQLPGELVAVKRSGSRAIEIWLTWPERDEPPLGINLYVGHVTAAKSESEIASVIVAAGRLALEMALIKINAAKHGGAQ